jgi:signal transduction histidine kinase/CheY-like chemotaxis protein
LALLTPEADRFELVPGPEALVGLDGTLHPARGDLFRYLAPLVAEESCRACHPADQVGAVRGAISVSVPAGPLLLSLDRNLRTQGTAYFIIWLVGLLGLGGSTWEISRKRERAEALSRTRSRFLANMSHDMRTPLTGIIGLSERMLASGLDPRNDRYARLIVQSAGTLIEVVGDILDFSRLDSGRLELERRPFDLREAVDRCARIFAFAAEEKSLRFEVSVDPAVPARFVGDEFRVRQVLANLLGNAVKFTDSGFVRLAVSAAAEAEGRAVLLRATVEDSGAGIRPEHLESIFGSFTQADDSLSGLRVLVVDDHGANRILLSDILREAGASVGLAASGPEALRLFEREMFDAVLMDLQMPGMDGVETTGRLRGLERAAGRDRCPILVLTAFAAPEDAGRLPRDEVDGLLTKPIDVPLLKRMLVDVAGARRDARPSAGPAPDGVAGDAGPGAAGGPAGDATGHAPPVSARPGHDAPAPEAPILEPESALQLLGGRRELYRVLTGEFVDGSEELRAEFAAALSRADHREVARLAHTLKTSSASLGAYRLSTLAARLELRARDQGGIPEELTGGLMDLLTRTVAVMRDAAAPR